jgi:hypothetical protein
MLGTPVPLSPTRRFLCDLLRAAARVPTVPVQRRMRLGPLLTARAGLAERPSWLAVFAKAFALVAAEVPDLRRAYVGLPRPRLYEYPASAASIALERDHGGEKCVFFGRLRDPARQPLSELSRRIRELQTCPVESRKEYRRQLTLGRLPRPLRRAMMALALNVGRQRGNYFGTFAITAYSRLGAESLHPLAPVTALNYGVIGADGTVDVRIVYDHRVTDGATIARALGRLESVLVEQIAAEMRAPLAA